MPSPKKEANRDARDFRTNGEHPPWRNMATSQIPEPSHRRPTVGDRAASGEATPPDPGPESTELHRDHQPVPDELAPPQPNNLNGWPEPEQVNTGTADDSATLTVIVQPREFRLPNVLRHIEAGKIVLVIPQHNDPG